jgi:hypothetical protein
MINRILTGVVIAALSGAAWLSAPADVSAKGFIGHGGHHHGSHKHHRSSGWVAYPDHVEPVIAMPTPIAHPPHRTALRAQR